MFRLASLFGIASLAGSVIADRSLYVWNNCGDRVWAHEVYGSFSQVYGINSHDGTFLNVPATDTTGIAVKFYTGCSDDSASNCVTGGVARNSGQTPFIIGEVTYFGDSVNYDISPLYGYNRALKINTDNAGCPGVQCNINSGCPVPGPDGSCYAPCCGSANGCLGTENCPHDPVYNLDHAGPGVNSAWYNSACPNAYSFPDDDCSHFGHTTDVGCDSNNRVTMMLCPEGASSQYKYC